MSTPLKIIADAHIWGVESAFSTLPGFDVDLTVLESSRIKPATVRQADILLTRSSTRVHAGLLGDSSVRFTGTATIGDDHYDKAWLDQAGIAWANAAGSSTGSVVEYMVAALLHLHEQRRISIPNSCIGIIGAGRIGSEIETICRAIGMQVVVNDPPRARKEGGEHFCSLDELLRQTDLITLHTPLIREGTDCTRHLLNGARLRQFGGRGVINAARGACVDNDALLQWLDDKPDRFAAVDCWEHEPRPERQLFSHAGMAIATPHIAGHSVDGKAANTWFIYRALCAFLHIEPAWNMRDHLPTPPSPQMTNTQGDCWHQLHSATSHLYALKEDHQTMQSWFGLSDRELPNAFTGYRRHYPVRRAWQHIPVHFTHADAYTLQLAQAIGIKIV